MSEGIYKMNIESIEKKAQIFNSSENKDYTRSGVDALKYDINLSVRPHYQLKGFPFY